MARKHSIPGVDEAALSELARQFPTHDIGEPSRLSEDPARGNGSSLGAAVPPRRGAAAGIALGVSIVALLAAAAPYVAPSFRAELGELLGDGPVVQTLLGDRAGFERSWGTERAARAEMERRLAESVEKASAETRAVAARVEQLNTQAQQADTRLGAIEAVGGGGFDAAAKRVEAVEAALNTATSRLGAVEVGVTEARSGVEAVARDVGTRLTELEQRALSVIEAKMGALTEQVGTAERAAGAAAEKAAAVEQGFGELRQFNRTSVRLFLIALHLRTAVQTPSPFAREIAAVKAVVGPDPEVNAALAVLGEHANGVRTVSDLRDTFGMVTGQQVKALAAGLDPSWASRLAAMVAGPQAPRGGEGERVWRVVVQAEQALAQGNLAAAINHVERFDGPAGAVVAEWLRDAKARLAVENAAAQLSIYALNQLVSGS
jgi:hypothetical protein